MTPTQIIILQLQLACDDANTRLLDLLLLIGESANEETSDTALSHYQNAMKVRQEDMLNRVETLMDALLKLPDYGVPEYRDRYHRDCTAFLKDWTDVITDTNVFPSIRRIVALWDASLTQVLT